MTELKTLKDLLCTSQKIQQDELFARDLRSAAREWIAMFEKEKEHWEKDTPTCGFDSDPVFTRFIDSHKYYSIVDRIMWIKHFFNLEEP